MTAQPDLPDGFPWPEATRQWWQVWGESDQAAAMTAIEWQDLLAAALLHAAVWGDYDIAEVPRLHAITSKYAARKASAAPSAKGTPLDELKKRRESRTSNASSKAGAGK